MILLVPVFAAAQDSASPGVEAERLSATVRVLASEEFHGRAPGGPGEEVTVNFLVRQFEEMGLEPGGENGGWTQAVPLIHTLLQEPERLSLDHPAGSMALVQGENVELSTTRPVDEIRIEDAAVVFVGFGASAPERQWDDFGAMDLNGKLALFLVNDPDFAAAPDEAVAGRFGNRRMTYYGRWTYKFEEAARRGATAALVIHEDEAAGYGWSVAAGGAGENYSIAQAEDAARPVPLQGWLHRDTAVSLFKSAGLDFEEQRVRARSEDFQAYELEGVAFNAVLPVKMERIESRNVLAIQRGTGPAEETVMISAHWDAYGHGEPDEQGRTLRAGANDDALGTAGVLELARVLKAGGPYRRSLVYALWTAEESGLLGSEAYATDPVYPLETTAANLTLDILQTAGPSHDVILVGEGQSDLESDLRRAAALQDRVVTPENLPENGLFFRADHFSLARRGVPVLLLMGIAGGADLVEGGRAAGDQWIADYVANCYHQPCDAWDPDWDLRGAVQDIELFHTIGRELADSERWPQWKEGSEFRAIRQQSAAFRAPR
jgi:Zn-dependent M28 family amino/carboxypeptidase